MKQRKCCFLILVLQIISSSLLHVSGSAISFASPRQDTLPEFPGVAFESKQVHHSLGDRAEKAKSGRRLGRIGSRPPNCKRKCGQCTPCVATQIPTTSGELGIQYTNYEPEGWTCNCHSTFFNP
ncbi:epidermal patterning factor like 3 [Hibiscus trionum]|uniref:Epidermal patterning factor-like protein n=1 Tax=Hibiscus trionum TaxID=183268 RepID=A0A9W7MMB3_HIBTR|nr:epidermal patterning factor like 3 [Hibiscus trionum]